MEGRRPNTNTTSPSIRFRDAISNPASSLSHLQRLSHKLDDIRNIDPSTRVTSLALAVQANRLDVAEWLMDEGHEEGEISRDSMGDTPLHVASSVGAYDIAELYLAAYPFVLEWVNAKGATPLHSAAMKGQTECAQLLIESGADIDAPDLLGNTPLHYASAWGKTSVVKLLIELDCQVGAKNNDGFTAADYSYSFASLKALEDCARAHFELQKRTRKHSKASRNGDGTASPGKSRRKNSSSQGQVPDLPLATPDNFADVTDREDYIGLGVNLPLTPTRPSPSASISTTPNRPSPSPSASHLSPSSSYNALPPPQQPSLSPISLRKIGRSPSASSGTNNNNSAPPSPTPVDSIRKISLRDQDAIESFRTFQSNTIGLPPPLPSPTPTTSHVFPTRRPTAIQIPAIGSIDNINNRKRSESNSSNPSGGVPGVGSNLVTRSRSGSNLSTTSSSISRGKAINNHLPTSPITPLISPLPPTPPSGSLKPNLSQQQSGEEVHKLLKKERRISSGGSATGEIGIGVGSGTGLPRGRSGSNDSAVSSGPGRVARALGLGKRT